MTTLKLTEIEIVPIKALNGLVGFASCVVNDQFYIGNIGIHSTFSAMGYRLVFPTKTLEGGHQLPSIYPINKETERAITMAIVEAYKNLFSELRSPPKKQGVPQ